jgi:hypothetical protein
MNRMTIHARKTHTKALGTTYVGFIRHHIPGLRPWTQFVGPHRLTREHALDDAQRFRDSLLQMHRTA